MKERTNYLHGQFNIMSIVGAGTKVIVQVPLTYQKEAIPASTLS